MQTSASSRQSRVPPAFRISTRAASSVLSRRRAGRGIVHVLATHAPLGIVGVLRRRDTLVVSTVVSLVTVEGLTSVLRLLLVRVRGIVLQRRRAVLRRGRHVAAIVVPVLVRGRHPTGAVARRETSPSPSARVEAAVLFG